MCVYGNEEVFLFFFFVKMGAVIANGDILVDGAGLCRREKRATSFMLTGTL